MQTRAVIVVLVGVWSAAVAAAAGAGAGTRKLSLAPPKLTPEQLRTLQDANVNPEYLKALHGVWVRSVEDAAHRWVESMRTAMDSLTDPDGVVENLEPGEHNLVVRADSIADTVRRILREGLESRGIPPLDPFEYSHVPVVFTVPNIIDVDGQLDNITFKGLSDFEADIPNPTYGIGVIPPSFTLDVLFDIFEKLLELSSEYRLDAHAEDLDIWGKGNISIKLFSLQLDGQVKVRASITVRVDPCYVNLSARKSKIEITGLFGGGVLTQIVGEIFTDLLNDNLDTLTSFLAQSAEDEICGYLKSKNTLELINLALNIISLLPNSDGLEIH